MKSLKALPDSVLLSNTKALAQEERRISLQVLYHLQEISRRELHLKAGFESLHTYCVEELKYSSGAAQRRIKSMELLEELPEVAEAIETGSVTLTSASMLQEFLKKTDQPVCKEELFEKIQNKSTRECERIFATIDPELPKPERVRAINATDTELTLTLDSGLVEQLDQLKALLSHQLEKGTYAELIQVLADKALKDLDPNRPRRGERKKDVQPEPVATKLERATEAQVGSPAPAPEQAQFSANPAPEQLDQSRYISPPIARFVWRRDESCCTYVDPATGRRCGSWHFLQIDHIVPFALGGSSTDPANLRLLCGKHNRLRNRAELRH